MKRNNWRKLKATSTTQSATTSRTSVVNQVVVRPLNRGISDIGAWRSAIKLADTGRRSKLIDLCEDMLLDSVLSSSIDKRRMAIANAEISFSVDGKPVPEIDDLIDSPEFEEFIAEIWNSKEWGHTLLELDFSNGFKATLVPRKNVNPKKKLILKNEGDEQGISYEGDDFFIEAGKPTDFGILHKVAQYCIYKRGGFGDWSQAAEIFGMPFRVGKYNSYDPNSRDALYQALDEAGSAAMAIIPEGTSVEFMANSTNINGNLYDGLRKACNEEILIGVLGQTMTTTNGSSKSQSETHQEVLEGINKADRRFVQRILNTKLLPILEKRGFKVKGGWFHFTEQGETISLKDRIEIDLKVADKVAVPDDYWYDTYGIPKPQDGNTKPNAEKSALVRANNHSPNHSPNNHSPNCHLPNNDSPETMLSLWERFLNFFASAPTVGGSSEALTSRRSSSEAEMWLSSEAETRSSSEAEMWSSSGVDTLLSSEAETFDNTALAERVWSSSGAETFDVKLFEYTAGALVDGITKGFLAKKFAIDYGFTPDSLKTAMELNLYRFSASKTLAECQRLNELFRSSKSFDEFKREAVAVTDVFNKQWLQTEYDTAYNTSENAATYHRLREQEETFPYWQYVTAGDGKVREEHRKLNGIILPANDPRWAKIYPPNGWNCRCRIRPLMRHEVEGVDFDANRKVVDGYFSTPEWKKGEDQGFGINRAVRGLVFTSNQFYVRKFPNIAKKELATLTDAQWGIPNYEASQKAAEGALKRYDNDFTTWWAKQQKEGKTAAFVDYKARNIGLEESVAKKANTELLDAVDSVFGKPTEVWINGAAGVDFSTYCFIKFYSDTAIVATATIVKGNIYGITSIVEVAKSAASKYRCGLLIKRP